MGGIRVVGPHGNLLEEWVWNEELRRGQARREVMVSRLRRAVTTVRPGRIRRRSGASQQRTDLRTSDQALPHLLRSRWREVVRGLRALSNELTGVQSAGMTIAVERCIVSRDLTEPKLSPDGRCVVFVVAAGGTAALYIDTLDGAPQRQLSAYPPPRPGRGFG